MKTFYFPCGYRLSWQRPTQYRPYVGFEEYPKSRVLWLGWLVFEHEWYDCAMTAMGIVQRGKWEAV